MRKGRLIIENGGGWRKVGKNFWKKDRKEILCFYNLLGIIRDGF